MNNAIPQLKRQQAAAAWAQVHRSAESKEIATRAFLAGCRWAESQIEMDQLLSEPHGLTASTLTANSLPQ